MSVQRITSATEEIATWECAEFMLTTLRQAVEQHGRANFAISGGSSPKKMFERMASEPCPWDRVHVFWVDERCVPPDDDQSNYKMAMEHLIRPAGIKPEQVHRILGEIDPKEAAAKYTAEIVGHFHLSPGALPEFDLIHRGMGPDGHTASLFPGDRLIDNRTDIAASTFAPQFNQWRVTLLPGTLLAAKHTAIFAPGKDKEALMAQVFEGPFDPKKLPSQLGLKEAKDERWFVTA